MRTFPLASFVFALLFLGITTDVQAQQPPPSVSFTDVTAEASMVIPETGAHGACWADFTGDGWPDLVITQNDIRMGPRRNYLFRNEGDGTFLDVALESGVSSAGNGTHGCTWNDLDNDRDYDLVLGMTHRATEEPLPNRVFRNDRDTGTLTLMNIPAINAQSWPTRAVLTPDLNNDGWAEIVGVTGWQGSLDPPSERNELYFGRGSMNFTANTTSPLVTAPAGQGGTDTDFDHDGDVDLIICNNSGALNVFRNNFGQMSAINPASIGITDSCYSGATTGDVDGDGDLDLLLIHHSPTRLVHLYLNNGSGHFTKAGSAAGMWGFSLGLADLDNDMDLDVVIPGAGAVFMNSGRGTFTPGPSLPLFSAGDDPRSVAFADYDRDGDLDMVLTSKRAGIRLLRNNLVWGGNWMKFRLLSWGDREGGFGAKVMAYVPGTNTLISMREAKSNYGYLSQDEPILHMGLGHHTHADVKIVYPDGWVVTRNNAQANRYINGAADSGTNPGIPGPPEPFGASASGNQVTLNWTAPESGGPPTSYIIQAGTTEGASDVVVLDTGNTNNSFFTSAPFGHYFVRVLGRNAAGLGVPTQDQQVTVGPCAPPVINVVQQTYNQVTLEWSGNSASYLLQAGSAPGLSNLAQVMVQGNNPTFHGVPAGTYHVRVKAAGVCQVGAPSPDMVITVINPT